MARHDRVVKRVRLTRQDLASELRLHLSGRADANEQPRKRRPRGCARRVARVGVGSVVPRRALVGDPVVVARWDPPDCEPPQADTRESRCPRGLQGAVLHVPRVVPCARFCVALVHAFVERRVDDTELDPSLASEPEEVPHVVVRRAIRRANLAARRFVDALRYALEDSKVV